MAALLCAKNLCKTYVIDKRQNNVLRNVNLQVNEGDMVAIMGPSGSGKSTLLYAISGMDRATGGQLQRACICRSMMNQPRLLFADEPTGALNRTSSNEVMDELVKLNREGTTIVMVTHDAKVAARCSRILYIVDGNIKGEYTHPEHLTAEKERERGLNNWLMDLGW